MNFINKLAIVYLLTPHVVLAARFDDDVLVAKENEEIVFVNNYWKRILENMSSMPLFPSMNPSSNPSPPPVSMTQPPTFFPSTSPTLILTSKPSENPTFPPTTVTPTSPQPSTPSLVTPTSKPSESPTISPSTTTPPAIGPSSTPIIPPTSKPSESPTLSPTTTPPPGLRPSTQPIATPTPTLTESPTLTVTPPSLRPSIPPVVSPTSNPSKVPTISPVVSFPCNIPPEVRSSLLTGLATQISGPISSGSIRDKALQWLIGLDKYYVCPDDKKWLQRYILAVFYFATNGDEWSQCNAPEDFNDSNSILVANENCDITTTPIIGGTANPIYKDTSVGTDAWLTPVYECEWAGIACQVENNCVDRIEFENNNLGGTIPFELQDLESLRFLILERGTLTGQIPNQLGNIEELLFLDLDFNQLTGTIPESILQLSNLVQLDLNDNFLSGTLSPSFGNLEKLIFLQLSRNEFSGTIPTEFGKLTSLLTGAVEEINSLTGSIPQELCDSLLSKSAYLLIADCNPVGNNPPRVQCDCCTRCYPL